LERGKRYLKIIKEEKTNGTRRIKVGGTKIEGQKWKQKK
jgi:hypothetical protein